jgi:hypothetical protein
MAIQKVVYLKLGRTDELSALVARDSSRPNPVYKRSWDIVNTEGHTAFVNELKRP